MPGRRDRNLRQGDINEEYGLFMLRLLGAVAPVPRTEDVGIDVFLTLLHEEGRTFFAGKTCVVQLKSDSVPTISFPARGAGQGFSEFQWLRGLEYPLFFAQVSVGTTLRLYSSNRLLAWFIDNADADSVSVCFDAGREAAAVLGGAAACVWLGEPIVSMTVEEAGVADTRASRVEAISQWVSILNENLQNAALGMFLEATWHTNAAPVTINRHIPTREPTSEESEFIMREAALRLTRLFVERLYHGEEADLEHLMGLLLALGRDCRAFTFDDQHQHFATDNIEHMAARRQAYRREIERQGGVHG